MQGTNGLTDPNISIYVLKNPLFLNKKIKYTISIPVRSKINPIYT